MATVAEEFDTAFEHHEAGELETAGQLYDRVLSADPHHADALDLRGLLLHQLGRHFAAIDYIGRAVKLKESAVYLTNLAVLFQEAGNHDRVVSCCQCAIEFDPRYFHLGWAYRALGKHEQAISHYRRALEIKPD